MLPDNGQGEQTQDVWDENREMILCYAAIKYKPVGMHKHFRMVNLQKHFNKYSPTPCTIAELWEKLETMYDLSALDEREDSGLFTGDDEDEEEDSEDEDEDKEPDFKHSEEFYLPLHEYDHLVTETVFREPSRNPSPSPARTSRSVREGSQTPSMAGSSRASTPDVDAEDTGSMPRKRRASRAPKKSDINETPSPRNASVAAEASRSTSANSNSGAGGSSTGTAGAASGVGSTRRATRAKPEPVPVTRGRKSTKK